MELDYPFAKMTCIVKPKEVRQHRRRRRQILTFDLLCRNHRGFRALLGSLCPSLQTYESYSYPEFASYGLELGAIYAYDAEGSKGAVSVSNDVGGPLDLEIGTRSPYDDNFCGLVSLPNAILTCQNGTNVAIQ